MEKKQNVPALRFQGFSGEWDMKYFKKLVVLERGGSPRPIDDYITTDDNGLNWVKIGDAPANGSYITHTAEKIRLEGLSKTRQVFPGDLILSNSMSFGKPYIMGIPGCIHDGWLLIRDEKHHFDLKYLCVLLGIPAMLRQYRALAAGSTVSNLNKELVGNTHVYIPDIVEQKKIGSFFDKLDQSIYWCENKIQKLQQFRQAMLTKLFPREGAAEPELRFRGFSGKWKCCRFGDIADIRRGLTYSPSSLRKSGIRVLRASNIQDDTFYIREDDVFVEPDAVNIPMVKNGDILIAAAGGSTRLVGKHAVIYGIEENSVAHGGFMLLASSDYPEFTNALMGANWYRHFVQQFIAGGNGAIGNLNKSDLEEQIVFVPDVAEMEQIGNFFKELDTYISLQQKKLERMQRLKAALLEKLFV